MAKNYTADQRRAVIAAVLEDMTLKGAAITAGVSHGDAIKLAWRAGFRRMLLTEMERAQVLAARKRKAAA